MSAADVRRPVCANDQWYPRDAARLRETVADLIKSAQSPRVPGDLLALISPHAGYAYSASTAAYAYAQLAPQMFERVVVIGPSHREDFGLVAASLKKFYATPLGEIELDQALLDALGKRIPLTRVGQDHEHSLEVQLPFLQYTLGAFKLVPLMMSAPLYVVGQSAQKPSEQLGLALADLVRGTKTLLVASSDLSHLDDYQRVKRQDAQFAEILARFDLDALAEYMARDGECRACGDAPILAVLYAARALGADRIQVLHLTNSGDVTGIRAPGQYTVGYLAAAVYRST